VALLASGLALSGCVSAPFVSSLESGKLGALRFQSLTVDEEDFLRGRKSGTPVTITGELRLPTTGAERVPAVVLVHGCSGLTSATDGWARELPRFGIATFLVDSFTGRNIREVCTGRDRITTGSRVIDAYRALELLATHPRIDAERIAMMGFSLGGRVALWTAFTRFQDAWGPPTVRFVAHLSVYPSACFVTLQGDDRLAPVPVRIMHGQADVFLCTTINESGVDNPRANTIIVNRSDALDIRPLERRLIVCRPEVTGGARTVFHFIEVLVS